MQIMKKTTIFTLLLLTIGVAVSGASKKKVADPVVITVGDSKVRLSEFEYLYKKNSMQQQASLTLDEYIDMFVNYKMKVEAARAAGLDTVADYLADMKRYGGELAAPYMVDYEMRDSLVKAAYGHYDQQVTVHHILLPFGDTRRNAIRQKALADSLRQLIAGGADIVELARRYSADPMVESTSGRMIVVPGRYPYQFEDMAYQTAVGQCSPVFSTGFGYHILRVDSRVKSEGEIKTRHILKMTRGVDESALAGKKALIDSIYKVVASGADFSEVAADETEDPSGKENGGALPWVSRGMMVPEFDDAAFRLADGEISKPVKTVFGYHIIKREGTRQVQPLDSLRDAIQASIEHDYRNGLIHNRAADRYASSIGVKFNDKFFDKAEAIIKKAGSLDESSRKAIASLKMPVLTIGKQKFMPSELVGFIPDDALALEDLKSVAEGFRYMKLSEHMLSTLADREPAYRNLYNEYSDGMLLFEISNREVWDRANKDLDGLEEYFRNHRAEYRWDVPHYRGFVVSAVSDSVADQAVGYLAGLTVADDQLSTELRKKFGNTAKVERVNAGKGDHEIIDYIAFDGARPGANGRWMAFRPFRGDVADQPQNVMDVKGAVSVGYQQQLEDEWVERLKSVFKVTVDRDALSSLSDK